MHAKKIKQYLKKHHPKALRLAIGLRYRFLLAKERMLMARMRAGGRVSPIESGADVVVSLTSFPARIEHAWIAIESIFQQDLPPKRIVLVLSEDEFPGRELPDSIHRQIERGLEVLWTPVNLRSFNKLIPTITKYPHCKIVTVDDDIIYEPWRVRKLVEAAKKRPGAIIGHRGWVVTKIPSGFAPYNTWPQAGPKTPGHSSFLTGVGGVLYPPNTLPLDLLTNMDLALKVCPLADDIWFWAVARKSGVDCLCLGNHGIHAVQGLRETPSLSTANCEERQNDVQLDRVMERLDLSN
jgi:hypothetical protein